MPNSTDATLVRQGRLGRQVLVILVASLLLAFMSAWVLWGAVANEATSEMSFSASQSASSSAPVMKPGVAEVSTD